MQELTGRSAKKVGTVLAIALLALTPRQAEAHPGTGIVVDRAGGVFFTDVSRIWKLEPDGRLYVTDGASVRRIGLDGRVQTLARDGLLSRPRLAVSGGNANHLMAIAVDGNGRIFVTNFASRSVLELAPDGRVSRVMRESWPWSPTGVALADQGDLLVLEYQNPPMPGASRVRVLRVTRGGRATVLATTSQGLAGQ